LTSAASRRAAQLPTGEVPLAEVLHRLPSTLEARSSVHGHRVLMDFLPDNPPPTPWQQRSHDLHGHFATVLSCETLRSLVCSRRRSIT
jgi:hypothetical protein